MNPGLTPGFEATAALLCRSLAETGPQLVDEFDDAWSPAGETYRDELASGGLVVVAPTEEDGPNWITLTAAGVGLAQDEAAPAA